MDPDHIPLIALDPHRPGAYLELPERRLADSVLYFVVEFIILTTSMYIAAELRTNIHIGPPLRSDYSTPLLSLLFLAAISTIIGIAGVHLMMRMLSALKSTTRWQHFIEFLVALGLATATAEIAWYGFISRLQLVYFLVVSIVLGWLVIVWPQGSDQNYYVNVIYQLQHLWENRALTVIWTRYNVQARYVQAFLGIAWIMVQPLATGLVLAFVFTGLLGMKIGENTPFIVFYLIGYIPWYLFDSGVRNGMYSVMGQLPLINQVYFPRESLVLIRLGEALVDSSFVILTTLLIDAAFGYFPNIHYLWLIPLLAVVILLVLGIGFFLSYLSVIIRDVPNLVLIILQMWFFVTPVIYPADMIPQKYRFAMQLNPLFPLVNACRDVMLYDRMPDLATLVYPTLLALGVLYMGYIFFKVNEDRLADYQ